MTVTDEKKSLPKFDGHDVVASKVKISGNGIGLNGALEFDPVALEIGESAYLTVRVIVGGVEHVPNKDDEYERVHKFKIDEMSFMDDEMAEKILAAQREEVQRRKDEIEGQERLDLEQREQAALEAERREGNMGSPA